MAWNVSIPDAEWYTAQSDSAALQALVREVENHKTVALDTETTGLDYMRDIPLYWSLSWHANDTGIPRRVAMRADTLPFFQHLFCDPSRDWVFANAKYDTHLLHQVGINIAGRLVDTQVMHALLYEDAPHKLDYMAQTVLGWDWKGFAKQFKRPKKARAKQPQETIGDMLRRYEREDLAALVEYASNDAYGTLEIYYTLLKELEAAKTWSLYNSEFSDPMRYPLVIDTLADLFWKTEVPFTKVLWKCERNGMFIDVPYLKSIEEPVEKEIKHIHREIVRIVGRPINPNSPQQLRDYFIKECSLRPLKMTKGGKTGVKEASIDADVLQDYADMGNPVARLLLKHRDLAKLLGTYVRGIQDNLDPYGRVHTHFNQDVARTGRLSSSEINLQNIPKPEDDAFKIRRAFIPERGNSLIVADYEQLEMRLLASAAMEQDMINVFLKGWDIHMGNAALVFGVPYEDIEKAKKIDKKVKAGEMPPEEMTEYYAKCLHYRGAAKAIGFGLNYGMKERNLAGRIGCDVETAKKLIDQYMDRYPTVKRFYAEAISTVQKKGYAFTLLGRRRFLPEILSATSMERWRAERQASNVPIQGTAADIVKMAMIACDEANFLDKYGWHMLIQVHDELAFEGPEETTEQCKAEIKEIMEHPLPTDLAVPTLVSIGSGHNWMDSK